MSLRLLSLIARVEGLGQLVNVQSQLQLGHRLPPERVERRLLLRGQCPRNPIEYAEASEGVTVMRDQWRPGVEPDPGLVDDERTLAKTLVGECVWHDEQVALLDRVRAKSDAARGFCRADARPRLEPLALL